jgi:spore coat protein U-like protein
MILQTIKWILLIMTLYYRITIAATTTTTLPISTKVIDTCDTLTAGNLSFGNYDPTSATPDDAMSTISVRCSLNDAYTITLNAGSTSGGSIAQRKMGSLLGQQLNYNLYTTSGRTTIWGDGVTGASMPGTGSGLLQTYTVYGRIPANQMVTTGMFNDTITVAVNY